MVYDPAWDMPKANWQQQGSFEIPEIPPAYEPDAEPLVCLPAINQYWLPYLMGALDQLRNPSSWLVVDDDAMYTTLARVTKLREMLGIRAVCMSYAVRFDRVTCQLQQSVDGGTTWTEVDGWSDFVSCLPPQTQVQLTDACALQESFDGGTTWETVPGWAEHFGPCVQDAMPVIGLPPNPGDQSPDQLACSIASYLANQVILEGLQAATTAITDDLSLLSMADTILTVIPEFILVRAFVDGASIVYTAVQEGVLSDFEAALTDASLWLAISCAIYEAIVGDGYVTPANCAAIAANIHAIAYTPSDVQDAIDAYVAAIGCAGLAQISQRAGLEVGADCSSCGGWCYKWDFTANDGGWAPYPAGTGVDGVWTTGVGWVGVLEGIVQELIIYVDLGAEVHIDEMTLWLTTDNTASTGDRVVAFQDVPGTTTDVIGLGLGATPFPGSLATILPAWTSRYLVLNFASEFGPLTPDSVKYITIAGTGTQPISLTGGVPC